MATATAEPANLASGAPLDSETLYEIINGERRAIPHMGAMAGVLASLLSQHLGLFALQHKLGLVMVEVLFRLRSGNPSRRPDLAFVSYDRWQLTTPPTTDPPELDVMPNLAVEVVSPTNTAEEIEDKIQEYFDAGVELVWVIYPRHRRIYVYESPTRNGILVETDELDGGKVLPGFRLSIAALFAPLVKPA